MPNMIKNRAHWRMQVERLLATDMTVKEWCEANRKSESAMFRWIGYFADHEPELFGGAQNIADRDGCKWVMKTRENMRASTALAAPAREASGEFVRIDASELAAVPAEPSSRGAGQTITVALNGAEVSVPAGFDEASVASVLRAVASL